jgi:CRISPR-associated protein Csc3
MDDYNIQIRFKIENLFQTSIVKKIIKEFFQNIFPKIFARYNTTPAKGGTEFKEYTDMSYPMHILNGILPSMLYLEQKFLENKKLSELVKEGDSDIKMLVKCTLLGITFHDINKLAGKVDLRESLEKLDEILNELGLEISDEEKGIVKYLIIGSENETRYIIDDTVLPKRRNLNRVIKDHLLNVVHLADSISIPPEESFSQTFKLLQKKLRNYFPDAHVFYFHETPYEVLSRYLLVKFIDQVTQGNGKIVLISPKGLIWIGKSLNEGDVEDILTRIEKEYQNLLLDYLDEFLTCDWQKAQLDIFRYSSPKKETVKNLIKKVLEDENRKRLALYRGLGNIEEYVRKETERIEIENNKLEILFILKLILTLTPENTITKNLKRKLEKEVILNDIKDKKIKEINQSLRSLITQQLDEEEIIDKKLEDFIKRVRNPLKNVVKAIEATNAFQSQKIDILYDKLVQLLTENYKKEAINIRDIFRSILSIAYLDNRPIPNFEIKTQEIGDKQNICSICGAETNTEAKEGVTFGFAPRGFTNRTVVSTKNTKRKICKTCLAEVMLRKLIFNRSKDLYAVYIDACDYTVPLLNMNRVAEKIEEKLNGIKALLNDFQNYYRIVYGYSFKDSKDSIIPFLMAHLYIGKETDFLRRFYELLDFTEGTGFKVYLTYAMNPDRVKKETLILDYAPKSIKNMGWDRIRINELVKVKNEFEILMNMAKAVGGRQWQNEFMRVLNDYSTYPLSFFYYLYRLDNPFRFINKNSDKFLLIHERIGGEIMGIIENLADKASEIEWSGDTASKQTWMIRVAIDALKTGVQRKLDKEDIIALIAGVINKKIKFEKRNIIEDFCRAVYEELYEKTWQKRIPSKTELRYWTYAFAFGYAKKSDEKYKKMKQEKKKQNKGGEENG